MNKPSSKRKRWVWIFSGVTFLITLQVAWWVNVFLDRVDAVERLQLKNSTLMAHPEQSETSPSPSAIRERASRSRFMFLSESAAFTLIIWLGLYLLYRALTNEERTRETQKNFIQMITHESKTPLTALKLLVESMKEKGNNNPNLGEDLDSAHREIVRLNDILEKTLRLTQVERQVFNWENVPIEEIIQPVIRRMRRLFEEQEVDLRIKMDANCNVKADVPSLQNSLECLLENAVRYNPEAKKRIAVEVAQKHPRVLLKVSDNGMGVSTEDLPYLFERFYRGRSAKLYSGTGLGLFLTRKIVEAHAGTIRALSLPEGGAQFEIELPAVAT